MRIAYPDKARPERNPTPAAKSSEAQSKSQERGQLGGGFDEQEAALIPSGKVSELRGGFDKSPIEPESDEEIRTELKVCKNWEGVKKKWLSKPAVMERIIAYRQRSVDGIVEFLKRSYPGLEALSLGSKALTSDYDITFSGPPAIQAVIKFNQAFAREFGAEAGFVFDTNVYAQNFLQASNPNKDGKKEGGDENLQVGGGEANAQQDQAMQDVMALVKVRKNMDEGAWGAFVSHIVAGIEDPVRKADVQSRYDQADMKFRSVYVEELYQQIKESSPDQVKVLDEQGKSRMDIVEELVGGREGLAASNRLYESKLLKVEKLIKMRDKLTQKQQKGDHSSETTQKLEALSVEIRAAHSDALLFANEPYFAGGTIRHVVGNLQGKWGLEVGAHEHFQSFNENYGDTLKELHHTKSKPFPEAAIKTSKYVYRFLNAAMQLGGQVKEVGVPGEVAPFEAAAADVLQIRQGGSARGQDFAKAPPEAKNQAATEYYGAVGIATTGDLEKKVTGINLAVNISARNKGAGGSSSASA
jgi:hypothetical protein